MCQRRHVLYMHILKYSRIFTSVYPAVYTVGVISDYATGGIFYSITKLELTNLFDNCTLSHTNISLVAASAINERKIFLCEAVRYGDIAAVRSTLFLHPHLINCFEKVFPFFILSCLSQNNCTYRLQFTYFVAFIPIAYQIIKII